MHNFKRLRKQAIMSAGVLLIATVLVGKISSASAATGTSASASCQTINLPVSLATGQPRTQTVSGTLCTPKYWSGSSHEVDVLTPGATYNSLYWNWPQDPSTYSYVDKTLAAGRATFDYDRIGTGHSSHPLSTDITFTSDAYVLHQIISSLHDGPARYKVNSIAHSYGSAVAVQEAGAYHDVNALVLTGFLHDLANPNFSKIATSLYPANLDPEFSGQNLDSGYLTTLPGTRGSLFYDQATANPSVIAYDEANKDTVSATLLATGLPAAELPAETNTSNSITAPVLLVVGQNDGLFCGAVPLTPNCTSDSSVLHFEAPYYTSAPSLTAETVPSTGHDLALSPSADQSFSDINQWLQIH
jgi:pimeloyl-ACP methyl ester carboxylesterase